MLAKTAQAWYQEQAGERMNLPQWCGKPFPKSPTFHIGGRYNYCPDCKLSFENHAVAELAALRAEPVSPQEEKAERIQAKKFEIITRAYERLNLCSDHRDKASGICIVCQAEQRTKQELREEAGRPVEAPREEE